MADADRKGSSVGQEGVMTEAVDIGADKADVTAAEVGSQADSRGAKDKAASVGSEARGSSSLVGLDR
jgi:hypothetical protein